MKPNVLAKKIGFYSLIIIAWQGIDSAEIWPDNIFPSPFEVVEDKQIPQERLVSIRLALFATFAYYGISHLLNKNKMFYTIHFLCTFLYFFSFPPLKKKVT